MPLIYRPPPLATSQTSRRRTAVGRMYPRARVREQADPVSRQDTTAAYLLGFIESLSLDSHQRTKLYDAAHGSKGKVNPKASHAMFPSPHLRDSSTPSTSTAIGKDTDEDKANIRASSIPRPRAILSSPDNDGIIGDQNKRSQKRAGPIKIQASGNTESNSERKILTKERRSPSVQSPLSALMRNQVVSNEVNVTAERMPLSLSTDNQQKSDHSDVKASHIGIRLENSQKRIFSSEVGSSNSYPKIKCSEKLAPKVRITVKRGDK